VPVPVPGIASGDVVYFAAWREEFLPAMTKLADGGVLVVTVPPPSLARGLPASYVIGSHTDFGEVEPEGRLFLDGGLRAVVITRGGDGVVAYGRDGPVTYPAKEVVPVDTTGAGDAFAAGFLQVVAGDGTLDEAVTAGIAWASATVQSSASIPPSWDAIENDTRGFPRERA